MKKYIVVYACGGGVGDGELVFDEVGSGNSFDEAKELVKEYLRTNWEEGIISYNEDRWWRDEYHIDPEVDVIEEEYEYWRNGQGAFKVIEFNCPI